MVDDGDYSDAGDDGRLERDIERYADDREEVERTKRVHIIRAISAVCSLMMMVTFR